MKLSLLTVVVSILMIVSVPVESQKKDHDKIYEPVIDCPIKLDSNIVVEMRRQKNHLDSLLKLAIKQNKYAQTKNKPHGIR